MYRFGVKVLLCWIGIIGILAAIPQSEAAKNAWTPLNGPFYEDVFVNALAVNPKDSSIIFAGTNRGVYKSIDFGNGWQPIKDVTWIVNALAINPGDPKIIYAGTAQGVYKSIDSGNNWMQILKEPIWILAINPMNPDIIFAGSKGVFRSKDSGQSWEKINRF